MRDRKNQKNPKAAVGSVRKSAAKDLDQPEEEKAERRLEVERRQFSYSAYIPERRSGRKRRKAADPADPPDRRTSQDTDE